MARAIWTGSIGFVRNAWMLILVPLPQMSGHSMSDIVTTNPFPDLSVWMAGTGVKPMVPSPFFRFLKMPLLKLPEAGHVVTGFGSLYLPIHRRSVRSACMLEKLG